MCHMYVCWLLQHCLQLMCMELKVATPQLQDHLLYIYNQHYQNINSTFTQRGIHPTSTYLNIIFWVGGY